MGVLNRWILICLAIALSLTACGKDQARPEGLSDIMPISEDCEVSARSSCCEVQCTDFCKSNGQDHFKHEINGNTCLCWCD